MSDAKRAEHVFRHNKPPRVPRLPEQKRQLPMTALALWIIFIAVAIWFIAG